MKRLKISREGIMLIKSFEGFRPRAIRGDDDRWVIGYGHTLSAREGVAVSEADAELLLQYDLRPVVDAVNDGVQGRVNQHQFDALASFALSVGVERFRASDVLQRILDGQAGEAADAMIGWPEPAQAQTALRRRAAERALFVADPATPVALADLLAAPLPPPPVETAAAAPAEPPVAEPAASEVPVPSWNAQPAANDTVPESPSAPEPVVTLTDARSAALAHLLEPASPPADMAGPEPETPVFVAEANPVDPVLTAEPVQHPEPTLPAPADPVVEQIVETTSPTALEAPLGQALDATPLEAAKVLPAAEAAGFPPLGMQQYSGFGAPGVGPLPALDGDAGPIEPVTHRIEFPALGSDFPASDPAPSAPAGGFPALTLESELPGASDPLVLTPLAEGAFAASSRLVWPETSREGPDSAQSPLFDEDATLHRTLGPVVRPDMIGEPPARFNWGETGAYLLMGGFGLVSFGMAMAAFRLASQQTAGSGDTSMIAWVLALIGAACVGVSSYNLYRRLGRPDAE